MPSPFITLTTDFGTSSPYVAAMKGVILSRCPGVSLIDLSHDLPPQDVFHAAQFLRDAVRWFPVGALHVVVIDPGVGTERLPLGIEINGQFIVCPDNGVWSLIASERLPVVHHLSNRAFQLEQVSNTFHGRDVFAPAAAALANGASLEQLGPRLHHWERIEWPMFHVEGNVLTGQVVFVDHFGNLITNIPGEALPDGWQAIRVGEDTVKRVVKTYGEALAGEIVALISSSGYLEVAQVKGNAGKMLGVGVGQQVHIQ